MGIVSTIFVFAAYTALLLGYCEARERAYKIGVWPSRVLALLLVAFGAWAVDSFVAKVPTPFAPAGTNFPASSRPAPEPEALNLRGPEKSGPSAREEHENLLKEWSAK